MKYLLIFLLVILTNSITEAPQSSSGGGGGGGAGGSVVLIFFIVGMVGSFCLLPSLLLCGCPFHTLYILYYFRKGYRADRKFMAKKSQKHGLLLFTPGPIRIPMANCACSPRFRIRLCAIQWWIFCVMTSILVLLLFFLGVVTGGFLYMFPVCIVLWINILFCFSTWIFATVCCAYALGDGTREFKDIRKKRPILSHGHMKSVNKKSKKKRKKDYRVDEDEEENSNEGSRIDGNRSSDGSTDSSGSSEGNEGQIEEQEERETQEKGGESTKITRIDGFGFNQGENVVPQVNDQNGMFSPPLDEPKQQAYGGTAGFSYSFGGNN